MTQQEIKAALECVNAWFKSIDYVEGESDYPFKFKDGENVMMTAGKTIRSVLEGALWNFDMDSAPKDGTSVLVLTHHGDIEISDYYSLEYNEYVETDGGLYNKIVKTNAGWNSNTPIAWRPLPSLPDMEN